jgi:hypothetical protein
MAEDITLEDKAEQVTHLGIIENQLQIIASIENMNDDMFDQVQEHKIRAINNAFLIIHNCQYQIFHMIKD